MRLRASAAGEMSEALAQLDSATLYEAAGREGALHFAIKPVWASGTAAGPALTVRCHPGDNLALHRAVAQAEPGDVLVVDAAGDVGGYWGEVLTAAAQARGVRALVIDGGVRDSAALRRRGFPAWARGVGIRGCVKATPGVVGEPITCGGVAVRTGDFVVGDADGVVVIAQERAADVLQAAKRRVEEEARLMGRLQGGELTLDLLGLREVLHADGVS